MAKVYPYTQSLFCLQSRRLNGLAAVYVAHNYWRKNATAWAGPSMSPVVRPNSRG